MVSKGINVEIHLKTPQLSVLWGSLAHKNGMGSRSTFTWAGYKKGDNSKIVPFFYARRHDWGVFLQSATDEVGKAYYMNYFKQYFLDQFQRSIP